MSLPTYSIGDRLAPYRDYRASARLLISSGGIQLPLAYTGRLDEDNQPKPTSRLLQAKQPTCTVIIEWNGVREGAKPEPVQIIASGDFIMSLAGAQIDDVRKDTNGKDIILASGFYVLHSTNRPEDALMPAFWCPWDGRYGSTTQTVPQYIYTPAELGFRQFLPGITSPATSGNPTLQNNQEKGGLIQ